MEGGLVATHKGVRVDDDVDSAPRLSGITVAEQDRGESSGLDLLDSVGMGNSKFEQVRQELWWSPMKLWTSPLPETIRATGCCIVM
jgi:hypothetical protein